MLPFPESVESIAYIRPGAKALIVKDGKIMIIREKVMKSGKEVIINDFPGGGIDPGESLEEALLREVYEELGLKVHSEGVIGAWDFVNTNEQDIGKGVHIICIGYRCSIIGDETIDLTNNPAEEEIFEVNWYTPQEIFEQKILTRPNMLDAVRAVAQSLEK